MAKAHLQLQRSEGLVFQAAANIYSAYVIAGRVKEGEEPGWMERSIRDAIRMAVATDKAVISDEEISSLDDMDDQPGGLRF